MTASRCLDVVPESFSIKNPSTFWRIWLLPLPASNYVFSPQVGSSALV